MRCEGTCEASSWYPAHMIVWEIITNAEFCTGLAGLVNADFWKKKLVNLQSSLTWQIDLITNSAMDVPMYRKLNSIETLLKCDGNGVTYFFTLGHWCDIYLYIARYRWEKTKRQSGTTKPTGCRPHKISRKIGLMVACYNTKFMLCSMIDHSMDHSHINRGIMIAGGR